MSDLLLGADIGTSACKVTLLRADDGFPLRTAAVTYRPVSPRPGWMEQDPDAWYQALAEATARALAGQGSLPMDVRAIGIAGQMRGLVLVDGAGIPIRPAILWNDNRCIDEVAELGVADLERLAAITRNVLNTMCTLPKVRWLQHHEPASLAAAASLLYPKDYVRLRLTGRMATDLSDASGSSLYDVAAQHWSDELLLRYDIDASLLPEVLVATDIAGTLNREPAEVLGLPSGIPVIVGGSDSTVESFSIGLTDAHSCKIRLGTSGAASTVVDDITATGRAYVWSFIRAGRWMLDTNTRACGEAVRWLRETAYAGIAHDDAAYAAIDADAASVAVGSDGLLFHPYLLGEDAPYWDPGLRASLRGLHVTHGRAHLARAVLEGTALALRDAMSTLGHWVPGFRRSVLIGGGSRSAVWRSIVADVLGLDAELPRSADASLGAAMLAGVGTGVFGSLEESVERCYRVEASVRHDPQRTRAYDAIFDRYRETRPSREAVA